MIAIWKRELQSYYFTPVGYAFTGVFLIMAGIVFYQSNLAQLSSDILVFLGTLSTFCMFLSPILTMRLLAEERHQQTDQLLLTSPVSVTGIVLGKYLAAVTVMAATVLCSLVYVLVIAMYGQVYPGELFVGYLGFILQGCAFLALDLYMSSLTKNQITAALCAFGISFLLWIMDTLASTLSVTALSDILDFLSLYKRYEPFIMGQLSFASIVYDLSFTACFLLLTIHHVDGRRLREG